MQNRYTGDIGDFSKLGLLRVLEAQGFSIGLNWYLSPDETHNNDGKHIGYLKDEDRSSAIYRSCDEALWRELKEIVEADRRVISSMEKDSIIKARFFSEMLDLRDKGAAERRLFRDEWHRRALKQLSGLDIICADPDNGLIVPSAVHTIKESKYILPSEIFDHYRQGSSVIYYQHKARKGDEYYKARGEALLSSPELAGSSGFALKFARTSHRYYFFVLQPKHKGVVTKTIDQMLETSWKELFMKL